MNVSPLTYRVQLFSCSNRLFYFTAIILLNIALLQSCGIEVKRTHIDRGESHLGFSTEEGESFHDLNRWWHSYDDPFLNDLIAQALSENLQFRQAISRLNQAQFIEKQSASLRYPEIDLNYDVSQRKEDGRSRQDRDEAAISVDWEIDLWSKLRNRESASASYATATFEEFLDVSLLLSFEVGRAYLGLIAKNLENKLLSQQIEVNTTYLGLTELRFANGSASVVDVYQQRQLLTAKQADLYLVKQRIIELSNRIHVLTGKLPDSSTIETSSSLPSFSHLPALGVPADLLLNRPDLRSLQAKLLASDYEVAVAVAERLPEISIGASAGLTDGIVFYRLFLDAFWALIDWEKRKNEVERRKEIAHERALALSESFYRAVEEVENSLWREKHYHGLLETLNRQQELAQATLRESRSRYMQGITDYLPVLTALQALQNLERRILQRSLDLAENRILLHKALGGNIFMQEEVDSIQANSTSRVGGNQ